jgi:hypothetical protein
MLDAYIIERIRRERERAQQDGAFVPLHIERHPPTDPRRPDEKQEPERGSTVIDFSV